MFYLPKHIGIVCFRHVRENTLTQLFSLCKSQQSVLFIFPLHFQLATCMLLFSFCGQLSISLTSFNDTPSFICTAAVRPDHLQGTYTHQLSALFSLRHTLWFLCHANKEIKCTKQLLNQILILRKSTVTVCVIFRIRIKVKALFWCSWNIWLVAVGLPLRLPPDFMREK